MASEVEGLRNENRLLLAALGRQTGEAWQPHLGEVVTIGEDWDGQSRYSHGSCLTLLRSDQVRVDHLSDDGWLWGQVEPDGPSGWFGGKGCNAVRQIEVSVGLGPQDGRSTPPRGMPGQHEPGGEEEHFQEDSQEYPTVDDEFASLDADAMEWIDRHGLDQSVQDALRELSAEDRRTVVGGELVNCRNPSAVALSRIKGMLRGAPNFVSGVPPPPGVPNGRKQPNAPLPPPTVRPTIPIIPRDAPARFRSRSPRRGTRHAPIGGPTFAGASPAFASLPPAPPAMQPPLQIEVEAYVQRHGIDEKAAQQLLDLPDHLARDVMQTDLFNVRNPSAVLMKRIRTVEQGGQPPGAPLGRPLAGHLPAPLGPPGQPPPPAFPPPPTGAPPGMEVMGQPPPPAMPVPRHMRAGFGLDPRVEDFVMRLGLDDKCAAMLRELPPHGQKAIMEVELVNVRNPSAVVQSRIQLFQRTGSISPNSPPVAPPMVPPLGPPPMAPPGPPIGGFGSPLPPPPQGEHVEEYVARFQLDGRVAQDLRAMPPYQQRQVIEMELTNARNPSAVVSSRIRNIRGQNQVMMKVEDYIARHQIDDSAGAMLRELSEDQASQVIMTDLSNCRNTSAVLMKRVRQITGR